MEIIQALPAQIEEGTTAGADSDAPANPNSPVNRRPIGEVTLQVPLEGESALEGGDALLPDPKKKFMALDKGKGIAGTDGTGKKPWADLFKNNRSPSQGVCLDDKALGNRTGECVLEEDDLLPTRKAWGHALIGYFAGKYPSNWSIANLTKNWKVPVSHYIHKSGWIVFQFQEEKDMMGVLEGGPYFAAQSPLLIKQMPEMFRYEDEDMKIMPVWVRLPCLPKECWGRAGLSKIISQIGKPLRMDARTSTLNAHAFARALVEVDASKDLTNEVRITCRGGNSFVQSIIYDYIPKFCTMCRCIGHNNVNCYKGEYLKNSGEKKEAVVEKSVEKEGNSVNAGYVVIQSDSVDAGGNTVGKPEGFDTQGLGKSSVNLPVEMLNCESGKLGNANYINASILLAGNGLPVESNPSPDIILPISHTESPTTSPSPLQKQHNIPTKPNQLSPIQTAQLIQKSPASATHTSPINRTLAHQHSPPKTVPNTKQTKPTPSHTDSTTASTSHSQDQSSALLPHVKKRHKPVTKTSTATKRNTRVKKRNSEAQILNRGASFTPINP